MNCVRDSNLRSVGGAGNLNFTVSAWVRLMDSNVPNDQYMFLMYDTKPGGPYGTVGLRTYRRSNGVISGSVLYRDTAGNSISLTGSGSVADGAWHMVTAVRNGNTHTVYIDANVADTAVVTGIGPVTGGGATGGYVRIGCEHTGDGNLTSSLCNPGETFFRGNIDDVRVYNRSLTQEEINELYNAPNACTYPPEITITEPIDGAIIPGSTVTIVGTTTSRCERPIQILVPDNCEKMNNDFRCVVLLAQEGDNQLFVQVSDGLNSVVHPQIDVVRDTQAPVIEIIAPLNGGTVGNEVVDIMVKVDDVTKTILTIGESCTLYAEPPTDTKTCQISLDEGLNNIEVVGIDQAGHRTNISLSLILDSMAPVVTIEEPAQGSCFGQAQSLVEVVARISDLSPTTVTSNPSGVNDELSSGGGIVRGNVNLIEGSNTITVQATEKTSSGKSGMQSIGITLDNTPPTLVLVSPTNSDPVRGIIDSHVSASDNGGCGIATVDVLLDGSLIKRFTESPFETMIDTNNLTDGVHTITVIATDVSGNTNSTEPVTILVDNISPSIDIGSPSNNNFVSGVVNFSVTSTDSGSGLKSIAVSPTEQETVFDPSVSSATQNFAIDTTLFADGPLPLNATASDAAGNRISDSIVVNVDNTNPANCSLQPGSGAVVSGTLNIEAAASDINLESIEIFVDGVSIGKGASPFSGTVNTLNKTDGGMNISATATDQAGNVTQCDSSLVTIDNMTVNISPNTINIKSRGNSPITVTAEGFNAGLLIPTESHNLALAIPGSAATIPSETGILSDDATSDSDGDGIPELAIRFSRAAFSDAIQAGIIAGAINPDGNVIINLVHGLNQQIIGNDVIRVKGIK